MEEGEKLSKATDIADFSMKLKAKFQKKLQILEEKQPSHTTLYSNSVDLVQLSSDKNRQNCLTFLDNKAIRDF